MWKILQAATTICVIWLLLRPDHYKAIRHELYEVWDSLDRRLGEEGDSNEQA